MKDVGYWAVGVAYRRPASTGALRPRWCLGCDAVQPATSSFATTLVAAVLGLVGYVIR